MRSLEPTYAIVSAAHGNQWGFPKADVVARWRASGSIVLDTATSGAIRIRLCGDRAAVEIVRYRPAATRIWHGGDAEF